jgi:hypothetical protein
MGWRARGQRWPSPPTAPSPQRDLPTGAGDWTSGPVPVSGGGTWHVGRFDPSTPAGVILSFSDGSQAELQLERDGSSLAMFYDLGDPDEGWSGQYRFVNQQSRVLADRSEGGSMRVDV